MPVKLATVSELIDDDASAAAAERSFPVANAS
jgi:hypothetical protein